MSVIRTLDDLIRALKQGSKLISDMFQKRKTVAISYDDAIEVLDGDQTRLDRLIALGIIERVDRQLELGEIYLRFFEEVLEMNEDINIGTISTFIGRLRLSIDSYIAAKTSERRQQLLREVRHSLRSIAKTTERNVVDLRRNIEITYKQEPNFKIKEIRLRDFDEKSRHIVQLIKSTEATLENEVLFHAMADVSVRLTIAEVRESLQASQQSLIDISAQIIDFLNRIEYQSKVVRKVRQLKYLRDQMIIEESTDIRAVCTRLKDLWLESRPRYITRVTLDFLRNDDEALAVLDDVRRRLLGKTHIKSRLAPPIKLETDNGRPSLRTFDHQSLFDGFAAQSANLFIYLHHYSFDSEVTDEERLVLFIQLATQFSARLLHTGRNEQWNNIEYPVIELINP